MAAESRPAGSRFAHHWSLDPDVVYLNHGSFGACPKPVTEFQQQLQARIEREPMRFFMRDALPLLNETRAALGVFIGADPDDLALINNATTGVNAVVRSMELSAGDRILILSHAYGACANAVRYVAARAGAVVDVVELPFPAAAADDVVAAVLETATERTVLAMVDHITSPTGLVLPIADIVTRLAERGIETLVDGAHAPGHVPLNLDALGAAYYTGNCHKWLCTPKGSAFLHVRRDRQADVRPTIISHGATMPLGERSRFRLEFDWQGTDDPSAVLAIPTAIDFLGSLLPGGWPALMAHNRRMALDARALLCERMGTAAAAPDDMIGMLAAVLLGETDDPPAPPMNPFDPLQARLHDEYSIQMPVIRFPRSRDRLIRISAQAYNAPAQYGYLANALSTLT